MDESENEFEIWDSFELKLEPDKETIKALLQSIILSEARIQASINVFTAYLSKNQDIEKEKFSEQIETERKRIFYKVSVDILALFCK